MKLFPTIKIVRITALSLLVVSLAALVTDVAAQNSTTRRQLEESKQKGLSINAPFKPAFFCTPAVNRIEARKGQTIDFEFRLEPARENVRIKVRPVALTQFETGALRADLEGPPPAGMSFQGKTEYDLQLGEEVVLRGRIKVPSNDSDFHSFGLLVQDGGYLTDDRREGDDVTFGVKFVSQYILRCDITVTNGRGSDIKNLQIESAELVEHNGVPSAKVMVFNPTKSTIEFQLQSKLSRDGYLAAKKSVDLFAQVNSSNNPPEKYITRIFPNSRLKMVGTWPNAVFPGQFEMETKVVRKRKTIFVAINPLNIGADSFPAQSTFAAQISSGVHVHPSQLYLSYQRGAKRTVHLHLSNFSTKDSTLAIEPVDEEGNPINWLLVRPQQVTVKPGSNRKAMLSLKSLPDRESHRLAFLKIRNLQEANEEPCVLPVAYRGTGEFHPTIATNAMRIDPDVDDGVFVVDLMNQSPLPIPINATIHFKSSTGNTMTAQSGFGKWLLPGQQRRIDFKIDASIAEGELPVRLDLTDAAQKLIAQRDYTLVVSQEIGPDSGRGSKQGPALIGISASRKSSSRSGQ